MLTVLTYYYYIFAIVMKHKMLFKLLLSMLVIVEVLSLIYGNEVWIVFFSLVMVIGQLLVMLSFAILQFVAIFWFMARSRTTEILPGDPKAVTTKDYRGQPYLLETMTQWMTLISDRHKFKEMGGRLISGILLTGEPGTGKSYMAKCIAGESNLPFIGIESSSFKAMFMGVDVMKVMSFFNKARKLAEQYGGCIAFMDEIDGIGSSRGGGAGGQGQTTNLGMMGGGGGALTRLLYEMDGLDELNAWQKAKNKASIRLEKGPVDFGHVLVMGSTNIPEALDRALKRPGRFDRIIEVNLPDRVGRLDIIHYYLSRIANDLTESDIEYLADNTGFATPVKIMSAVCKDAVRLALFSNKGKVTLDDIEMALQEQAMGIPNPIADLTAEQQWQVAIHEAGHAVAQWKLMEHKQRIVRLSITRRTGALGYMLPVDKFDIYAMPLTDIVRRIVVGLAGHVATIVILGEPWTGATSDFMMVRNAILVLNGYGIFESFPVELGVVGLATNLGNKDQIEEFVRHYIGYTQSLLEENRHIVLALANALIEKKDLSGREVYEIIDSAKPISSETSNNEVLK